MAILLESDKDTRIQSHLDELSKRTVLLFITIVSLTLIWSFSVDELLRDFLAMLHPCQGDCLNVYDPAQWSAIRWLSALYLAFLSSLPLLLHHVHRFAKPGLAIQEYKALKRCTMFGTVLLLMSFLLMTTTLLPMLFKAGHENHLSVGLSAQYSAVEMLSIATYLTWIFGLLLTSWLIMFTAGQLKILTQTTAEWWRVRVYGISSVLILLTVPEQAQALAVPLVAILLLSNEFFARPWMTQTDLVSGRITDWFDADGRRRRLAVIQSKEGKNRIDSNIADDAGFSLLTVGNWHERQVDRERVLLFVQHQRITDVMVHHDAGGETPTLIKENFERLGIMMHTNHCKGADKWTRHPFSALLTENSNQPI
jgi:Sec-independent protein secretion pathway component TatC